MVVDASAITAILTLEEDGPDLLERMERHAVRIISPVGVWETAIAVSRKLRIEPQHAAGKIEDFLRLMSIGTVPITGETSRLAVEAFSRFGKGRHPAALNMGDCFAYACARIHRVPLLCKGEDFALTDIERA
jgi:ribonuclease VapC